MLHGIVELPFWKNSPTLAGRLLGGWTVSFVSQFQTGNSTWVGTGDDFAGVGPGSSGQSWVLNGDPGLPRGQRKFSTGAADGNYWFKTRLADGSAMFTAPASGTFNPKPFRNLVFGPGLQNHNLSVFKDLPVGEGRKLQLRLEAFNWLNHPNWNFPGLNPTVSSSFGKVQSKSSERSMQIVLRYSF